MHLHLDYGAYISGRSDARRGPVQDHPVDPLGRLEPTRWPRRNLGRVNTPNLLAGSQVCAFAPSLVGCNTGTACECTSTWSVHDFFIQLLLYNIEVVRFVSLVLSCRPLSYQSYHCPNGAISVPISPYPSRLWHQIQHMDHRYLTHTAPRACVRAAPAATDLMHA